MNDINIILHENKLIFIDEILYLVLNWKLSKVYFGIFNFNLILKLNIFESFFEKKKTS